MTGSNTISITEARKRIFDLARKVQSPNCHFILTEKGVPKAALISAIELESYLETLEVLREFPEIEKEARQAYADYREGKYWVLKDAGNRKYKNAKKAQSSSRQKSKKRVR